MNWSGAKNWLIALFAGLNIFLIIMLVSISSNAAKLEKHIISDTVTILKNNGVEIDETIIPEKIPKLNSVEVSNAVSDKDSFAKALLGDKYKKGNAEYLADGKILRFSQSKFFYTNSSPDENYVAINEDNAAATVSGFLSGLSLSLDAAEYQVTNKNETYTVIINQKLDKYPLFDSKLTVAVSKRGIHSIEGSWFYVSQDQSRVESSATRVTPSTGALIDFISDSARISNKSNKITEITIGYTAGETADFKAYASAIPVWRIKTADGHSYYFDAR